jgi:serine/threonine-protein kinase RIO1
MLILPAHQHACKDANILHRDISIGNIIVYQGEGLLIDWELSCDLSNDQARVLERTVRKLRFSDLSTTDPL